MRTRLYPTPARILCALLIALQGLAGCTSPAPGSKPVTLVFVTGLQGTTEPCGCTSDPLGGLDRLVTMVENLRKEGPVALFLVGSTFYELADPPAHRWEQERAKAEVIAQVIGRLKPAAILPGPNDTGVQRETLSQLARDHNLPILAPPRTMSSRHKADSTLLELQGVKVGVVGIPSPATPDVAGYAMGARVLRKEGADVVIGLVSLPFEQAQKFAAASEAINVIVAAGSDDLHEPVIANRTLVVEASNKGQYLGILELRPTFGASASPEERRTWVYFDEGKSQKQALRARIERLEKAVAGMPEGDARTARSEKLAELQQELAAVKVTPPETSYISWRAEKVRKKVTPAAPWAANLLASYNRSLCDITKAATADLNCAPAPTPAEAYVGTQACVACHPDAVAVYEKTRHAHAWETLTQAGKECDVGCIGCHTVGYDQPGGYCRLQDAETNKNVGCENCHGPGGGHVQAPGDSTQWGASFRAKPGEETCLGCHNQEHSDLFNFAEYLPKVLGPGHGQPKLGANSAADSQEP